MTKIQETLWALPEETKAKFVPVFGDMETFYTVVYLIARNEHITELEKPEHYEARLGMIRGVRRKVEAMLASFGLNGEDIVADIASDYFEDYVAYREPEIRITNEKFVELIKKLMSF